MNKGYLYIAITALAFSTMELAGKVISDQFNPFQLTFLRFFIGGLILLPLAIKDLRRRQVSLNINDFLFFMLTGFLGIVVSMSFFQLAILYTKASTVAILFSTNPVFTIPFAYILLKEKLNRKMLFALGMSIVGILFFLNPFSMQNDFIGIPLSLAAAVSFSLFGVVGKTRINRYGGLVLNCFSFLLGNCILYFFLLYANIPVLAGITKANIIYILYLGIFVTGAGYVFYFTAMKETSAVTASTVFLIKPALAPLLAYLFLHEAISPNTWGGILLILIGAVAMLQGRRELIRQQ